MNGPAGFLLLAEVGLCRLMMGSEGVSGAIQAARSAGPTHEFPRSRPLPSSPQGLLQPEELGVA